MGMIDLSSNRYVGRTQVMLGPLGFGTASPREFVRGGE